MAWGILSQKLSKLEEIGKENEWPHLNVLLAHAGLEDRLDHGEWLGVAGV